MLWECLLAFRPFTEEPCCWLIVWLICMAMLSWAPGRPAWLSTIIAELEALFRELFKKLSSYFCFTFLSKVDEFYGPPPCESVWLTINELFDVVTTV